MRERRERESDCQARTPRRPAGFTLVELLVVIAIVAMLVSILMPSLSKARMEGNRLACSSNLRQIGSAAEMYAGSHEQFAPGPCWSGISGAYNTGSQNLSGYLAPYLGYPAATGKTQVDRMFICPGLARVKPGGVDEQSVYGFICKPDRSAKPPWGRPRVWGYPYFPDGGVLAAEPPLKIGLILAPSSTEAVQEIDALTNAGGWANGLGIPQVAVDVCHGYSASQPIRNYLYFDGHAEAHLGK